MKDEVKQIFDDFKKDEPEILKDLLTFLRFKSIGTEENHRADTIACAEWLISYLKDSGLSVSRWETKGFPCIFAEHKAGDDKPTVLFYGHYDVQPVDPIELWTSDPFEPRIEGEEIYARGAADDKGQIFYTITAIRHLLKKTGSLPLNVKILIEGEEEAGSAGLSHILAARKNELRADHLVIVDTGYEHKDRPAVTIGMRGICAMTVTFTGSNTDLHSGVHGGIAFNPNHALVEVLAKLRDAQGKVLVPGFYDNVQEPNKDTLANLDTHFSEEEYAEMFGAKPTGGEKKYDPIVSNWLRPSLEINGIGGGYTGTGFKTVIPGKAIAKISCRLVPEQNPILIAEQVAKFIKDNAPEGIAVTVEIPDHAGIPFRSRVDCEVAEAARRAYTDVLGQECKSILCGASIPIVSDLSKTAEAETVLLGFLLPDDKIHAPNEHFGLDRFRMGHATIIRLLSHLGK